LTDLPRIFFVDAEKMEEKGKIKWSDTIKVTLKNSRRFVLHVPNHTYMLEDTTNVAEQWIEAIEGLHKEIAQKQGQK